MAVKTLEHPGSPPACAKLPVSQSYYLIAPCRPAAKGQFVGENEIGRKQTCHDLLVCCHDTGLGTFTHQLDRILPVAVPQSGLAPPYTQRRLGSGRFYDVLICQFAAALSYRTEHSDAVKIIAFAGGMGLLQDHLSQLLWHRFLGHSRSRCRSTYGSFAKWNYHGHGNLPSGHRRTISTAAMAKTNTTAHAEMAASHRFA